MWVAATDEDDRFYTSARGIAVGDHELAVLDLTLYEVANVVTRRFKVAAPAIAAVHAVLAACRHIVHVDTDMIAVTVSLAAEHDLTAYDAGYVAAAHRYDWTLVSTDIKDLVSRGLALAPDDPSIQ